MAEDFKTTEGMEDQIFEVVSLLEKVLRVNKVNVSIATAALLVTLCNGIVQIEPEERDEHIIQEFRRQLKAIRQYYADSGVTFDA